MSIKKIERTIDQSTTFQSEYVNIDKCRSFALHILMSNGDTFDGTCSLQLSNLITDNSFEDVPNSELNLTGTDDSQIYDYTETATSYARAKITIVSGSADFTFYWTLK